MSDSNRLGLSYAKENVFAQAVAGAPFKRFRYTGESLQQTNQTVTSNEIRADRMTADVKRVSLSAAGDINFEMSYGAYDDILEAVLQATATWTAPVVIGPVATLSAAAVDKSFSDSGNGLATLAVGQWIRTSGFTTPANNGFFKIVTKAAGKITVSGGTLVDEIAGAGRTITQGGYVTNGTTMSTFNIEKDFSDLAGELALLLGMSPAGINLSVQSSQLITGTINWMGKCEQSIAASTGNGYTEAPTNDVQSATDDVFAILENGETLDVVQFTLGLNNNLRAKPQVAVLGPKSLGSGSIAITGTLQAYYETKALMDKHLNMTASSVSMVLKDGAGNAYVFELPRIKFTNGKRVGGGLNTDIIADMSYTGIMNATDACMIKIARFPSA